MEKKTLILKKLALQLVPCCLLFITTVISAQVGNVLWEDNFDSFDASVWNIDIGDGCDIGLCGWGNAELEWYNDDNVTIEPIPGESGNNALVFTARNEAMGGRAFTSGKVTSEQNLSVHYGLIEIRMRTPNLGTGLWPAAWLLGTANITWPGKGEIDMMEMGHAASERARLGHPGSNIDSYVGANAIFANEDGSVGSIAYDVDYNQPYVADTPLANRFVTYRLYWEPTQMRYTIVDQGVEYDLYAGPLPIDPDGVTGVFSRPFFLLMNLAVGGNFTDAGVNGEVSAPLPAKMYIDYVRVSEWNGHGTVERDYGGVTEESGVFGVYTETTPVDNQLTFGSDAEIYGWGGTVQEGTEAPFEGSNVIAWETVNASSWFGGGVAALFGRNMSNFVADGSLKFKIKIPADVTFRIGITDNFTNEKFIEFPAGETKYGLVRNGNWGAVEIPLVDFSGLIAFQNINYMFAISSVDGAFPSTTFQFAVDDIVWDSGNGVSITPVTGITVTPTSSSLEVGENQTLTASISPSGASNQQVSWSSSNPAIAIVSANGIITAVSVGNAIISATTADGGFTDTTIISVTNETSTFVPDPDKTYYIINPNFNQKIGANGSQDPFTTAVTTTGATVEWKITPSPTAGYYYIDGVGGGNAPRIRTDNTQFTDMQATTSRGSWTRWNFTSAGNGTYYLNTLGSNLKRLQVTNTGQVKMVTTNAAGSWEQFILEEATTTGSGNISERIEAEDYIAMNGIQTENTSDTGGGRNVGFIDQGDWMDYTITVPTAGTYTINSRMASVPGNAAVQFQVNGSVLGTTNIYATGGWQSWITLSTNINLAAGTQTLRLYSVGDGFNINWFELESQAIGAKAALAIDANLIGLYPVPAKVELNVEVQNYESIISMAVLDLNGRIVFENKSINQNITIFDTSSLNKGLYLIRIQYSDAFVDIKKFVK